jgi:hypothetical protein
MLKRLTPGQHDDLSKHPLGGARGPHGSTAAADFLRDREGVKHDDGTGA